MKFSFGLITTLVSVALSGIVYAAPAPLCDRTNGLCADIAARDVADSMMADDLVARAGPKKVAKKAANAKIQRQAAPKVERKVKASGGSPAAANKLRNSEKGRVATQAQKNNKAAKTKAWNAAANRGTTTKNIQAVQKAQGQKPRKQATKKATNTKIQQKAAPGIKKKVQEWRAKEKAKGGQTVAQINAKADKMTGKEKGRALTQARKDRKADRGNQWAAKKNDPTKKAATKAAAAGRRQERQRTGAPSPANQAKLAKNVRPTKQEKKNVKDRFQAARQKYGQTQGMPARGQTATVGTNSANGREVRNSVFNSYLHQKNPIGMQRLPKQFRNEPYSATHGNAALRNQRPLPPTAKKLKEYPVIKGSPNGWTGNGQVGALRTITYKNGGQRHAAVVGHDTTRGGTADDHYVATVTRDLESEDFE